MLNIGYIKIDIKTIIYQKENIIYLEKIFKRYYLTGIMEDNSLSFSIYDFLHPIRRY